MKRRRSSSRRAPGSSICRSISGPILPCSEDRPTRPLNTSAKVSICSRALHDKFAFVYALTPLAAAAALKGDDTWAARVLGTRDAVTEQTGASSVDKSVRELRERTEQEVRGRLGSDRWAREYAAGRRASIDSLLKDIENAQTSNVIGT